MKRILIDGIPKYLLVPYVVSCAIMLCGKYTESSKRHVGIIVNELIRGGKCTY